MTIFSNIKPIPGWFKIIAGIAILWNLMGLLAVGSDFFAGDAARASLTPAQQAVHAAMPIWAKIGSIIAVMGGTLGSIALFIRRRWAVPAYGASLAGLAAQDAWMFGLSGGASTWGNAVWMQLAVAAIAIALLLLARNADQRGWLL